MIDMTLDARFAHTNLTVTDLDLMSAFYCDVFGCRPTMDVERYGGPWVEAITAVPGAAIDVQHLRLPGGGEDGPTLELIRYAEGVGAQALDPRRPGFGHVAFHVDDVGAAIAAVEAAGGGRVGKVASVHIPGRGSVTEVYVTDPEGNIIELCCWTAA